MPFKHKWMPPGAVLDGLDLLPPEAYVLARNKSGGNLVPGDVVVLDPTTANNVAGNPYPVATTTSDDVARACGVVPANASTIPNGADFFLQVSGLHTGVKFKNVAVNNGDAVSTSTTAGQAKAAAAAAVRFGFYVGANLDGNQAAGSKYPVVLTNPLGLV